MEEGVAGWEDVGEGTATGSWVCSPLLRSFPELRGVDAQWRDERQWPGRVGRE